MLALLSGPDVQVAVSAVNLCEVATKILLLNATDTQLALALEPFLRWVVPFESEHADETAKLVRQTKPYGLSLGDRACLALAQSTGGTVWTTDGVWKRLKLPISIKLLRS